MTWITVTSLHRHLPRIRIEIQPHSPGSGLTDGADRRSAGVQLLVERILDRAEYLDPLRQAPRAACVGQRPVVQQEVVAVVVVLLADDPESTDAARWPTVARRPIAPCTCGTCGT